MNFDFKNIGKMSKNGKIYHKKHKETRKYRKMGKHYIKKIRRDRIFKRKSSRKNALMTEKVKEFDSKELIRTFLIKPDLNRNI